MTPQDLAAAVEKYQAGIEAELRLLKQLEAAALRQREATEAHDLQAFAGPAEERDRLTQGLAAIEDGQRRLRKVLFEHGRQAERTPGFDRAVDLHREASTVIDSILATDRAALRAFRDAETVRRAALSGLDHGETTLAAYRKVLAPAQGESSLVDARG